MNRDTERDERYRYERLENVEIPETGYLWTLDLYAGETIESVRVSLRDCDKGKGIFPNYSIEEGVAIAVNLWDSLSGGQQIAGFVEEIAVRIRLPQQKPENEEDTDADLLELENLEKPAVLFNMCLVVKESDWPMFREALGPVFALMPEAQRFEQNKQVIR